MSVGSSFAKPRIKSWLTTTCRRREVSSRSSARTRTAGLRPARFSSPMAATAVSSASKAVSSSAETDIERMFEFYYCGTDLDHREDDLCGYKPNCVQSRPDRPV